MKLVFVLVGNTACVVPVCLSFSFLSVLLYCVVIGQCLSCFVTVRVTDAVIDCSCWIGLV